MTTTTRGAAPTLDGPGDVTTAGDVVLAALRAQVDKLRAQEPKVRAGADGAVSRMRVTTRQLRSTLRGFSRVLDREATRPLVDELKWLGAQLGEENDTEAVTEQFHELLAELPKDLIPADMIDNLELELGRLSDEGKNTVLSALASGRYLMLSAMLDQLVEQPPLSSRAAKPAQTELPKNVTKALRRLDRRLEEAAALPPGPDRDAALHEARKADKLVRYMTDIVAPVIGKPAKRLRRQAKKLQDLLGDYQDAVIARSLLHRLSEAAHARGHPDFVYDLLDALERAHEERVLRKLPSRVERLHDDRALSWLPQRHHAQGPDARQEVDELAENISRAG
jgi:CHAD domain-containing protein